MKLWKTAFAFIFLSGALLGQYNYSQLRTWHQSSLSMNVDIEKRRGFADSLWNGLQDFLEEHGGIKSDSLPTISQVELNSDNKVLYTWLTRNENLYSTWGILYDKKKKTVLELGPKEAVALSDNSILKKMLSGGKWPSMLIYEAVPYKRKGQSMYLLLGFYPGSDNVNYKHLDVLTFDKAGAPIFGSRHILWEGQKIGRKTFVFSAQASMILKLEKKDKRVVMDHLAPASPELKGQFAFYGPDLSYDALEFNGEEWILLTDVDLKNPSQDLGQPGQIQRFGPKINARRPAASGNN
jgi:hypothetical protein